MRALLLAFFAALALASVGLRPAAGRTPRACRARPHYLGWATIRRRRAPSRGSSCSQAKTVQKADKKFGPRLHQGDPRARQAEREALRLHDAARPVGQAEALPALALPAALLVLHARRARVDGRGDRRQAVRLHLRADHRRRAAWRCSTTTSCTTASRTRPRRNPDEREGPVATAAASSITGTRTGAHRALARVGTEEFHSMRLPTAQEAAVLYSANHSEAAIALLQDRDQGRRGQNNKQAWLMLFDLYQAAQNRPEFDALSMLFTVKFEQSPPAWAEGGDAAADPRRAPESRERKDLFVLKPNAYGRARRRDREVPRLRRAAGHRAPGRGQDHAPSPPRRRTLLGNALLLLRKRSVPMWFNNLDGARDAAARRLQREGHRDRALLLAAALRAADPAGQGSRSSRSSASSTPSPSRCRRPTGRCT